MLANLPVLIVALGMTLVILTGEIDISVGSVFAICGVARRAAGESRAADAARGRRRVPAGALLGVVNGALVAYLRHPVDRRDAGDDGGAARRAAVGDARAPGCRTCRRRFQWLGLTQARIRSCVAVADGVCCVALPGALRHLAAGRAIYATGSNPEARASGRASTPRA